MRILGLDAVCRCFHGGELHDLAPRSSRSTQSFGAPQSPNPIRDAELQRRAVVGADLTVGGVAGLVLGLHLLTYAVNPIGMVLAW
jgi:hypothetical protein